MGASCGRSSSGRVRPQEWEAVGWMRSLESAAGFWGKDAVGQEMGHEQWSHLQGQREASWEHWSCMGGCH